METKNVLLDLLDESFETGAMVMENGGNFTLPNGTLPSVATAKYVYDDVNLQEEAQKVREALEDLDAVVEEEAQTLRGAITSGEETCSNVANGLDSVELRALQWSFGIPFTILPLIMLALLAVAAMGSKNSGIECCISYCLLPVFALLVALLVLMTAGFSIGGIVNADFCSGGDSLSPDETLLLIMAKKGIEQGSMEYQMVQYLVNVSTMNESWPDSARLPPLDLSNCFHLKKGLRI